MNHLPLIIVSQERDVTDNRITVTVPGRGAQEQAMVLRIAAEATEAMGALGYKLGNLQTYQDKDGCKVKLYATPGYSQSDQWTVTCRLLKELHMAAQREACVHTARHPTGIVTHAVKVAQ